MDSLITVGEACELMKIARSTLYVLISERKIGTVKIRKSVRIKTSDIAAYIDAHYRGPRFSKEGKQCAKTYAETYSETISNVRAQDEIRAKDAPAARLARKRAST